MKFKCIFLGLSFVAIFNQAHSQNVGINSSGTAPDNSAMLDIVSSDKGLLIPRLALTQTSLASPVNTPTTSLLIYNTASQNDVTPGYYYWNGSVWVRLATGTNNDWTTTGNAGTSPSTNFIGTTDGQDFVLRTNNTEKMRVTSTGSVGINNSSPTERLDITGNVKYSGALMPNNLPGTTGQILTSGGANNPSVWLGQGTSGQVLTSAGASAAPTWGSNRALSAIVVYTTGTGNYVPSAGTTAVLVELVGGGGAGGSANFSGCAGSNHVGAGGGSGGYCRGLITSLSASYAYTVGTGGVPSSATCGNAGGVGGAGGNTTFGSFVGAGGAGGSNSVSGSGLPGGAGGTASGGNVNLTGGTGGYGACTTALIAGPGAASYFGGGAWARSGNFSAAGFNANTPGAGGGGASAYTGTYLGGNGAAGIIIIYEYK